MGFKILFQDKKTKARVGKLITKSGEVETPFFMPVATYSTLKHLSTEDIESMNIKVLISNALMLHLRPGEKIVKKLGGIKKFMSFSGISFTDSGGFQMYSPRIYLGADDKGVYFKNHYNVDKIFMTPEKDMQLQLDLDSDVAMCLDSMPLYKETKEEILKAVDKTTEWAKRCKLAHDKIQKNIKKDKRQLLFSISQGGVHQDLREKSSRELGKVDFDGYAIGGIALPESLYEGEMKEAKKTEYEMIKLHKSIVPANKPIYLMGEGRPLEILNAVSLGVDIFDSRFPTKNARNGHLFTSRGILRLRNAKHKNDPSPIDKECGCRVCKRYSRAYLRHLMMQKSHNGYRLLSYHNVYFVNNLVTQIRESIKKGKFASFAKTFKKNYKE